PPGADRPGAPAGGVEERRHPLRGRGAFHGMGVGRFRSPLRRDGGRGRRHRRTRPMKTGEGATRKLARHAATLEYEALPSALVDLLKQCVLDTLGVATGASTLAPEATLVADYVMDLGGKPESTILGFGGRAHAAWAA